MPLIGIQVPAMADIGWSGSPGGEPVHAWSHDTAAITHKTADEEEKTAGEGDTCRICRSEGSADEPLFHPCKCSGSIKFVHQECLMEWLSHTNKKHCELCKTSFRFTKLYDADMPDELPYLVFISQATLEISKYCLAWLRAILVASIWLVVLPYCIRWSWRVVFFFMDAGWAREPWIFDLLDDASPGSLTREAVHAALGSDGLNQTSSDKAHEDMDQLPTAVVIMKAIWNVLTEPWRWTWQSAPDTANALLEKTSRAASASLLSDLEFARSMTNSPSINRAIVDILEGQIITIVVVVAFILVFLIREWVIQQQPILNAAAHVRDAEQELERVEQVRQKLQEEIRFVEMQLAQLNSMDHPRQTRDNSHLVPESMNRSHSAPNPQAGPPDHPGRWPHVDWAAFKQRVNAVTEDWMRADRAQPADATRLVLSLIREVTGIIDDVQEDKVSDIHAFRQLIEWGRRIPPDVDAVWLADIAIEFAHVGETFKSDQTVVAPRESQSEQGRAGPPSPIDLRPFPGFDAQAGHHETEPREAESSHTRVETSSQPHATQESDNPGLQMPATNEHNAHHSYASDDAAGASSEATRRQDGYEDQWSMSTSLFVDDEDHPPEVITPGSDGPPEALGPTEGPDQALNVNIHAQVRPSQGVFERLYDFFWGWVDFTGLPEDGPRDDVFNNAEDMQFVDMAGANGGDVIDNDVAGPAGAEQDPEVLAAAAEAGLNAEAIEEAEDLEGVLELIGMQGPIIVLFQTAFICGGLITLTLWAAIGAPYLFGKLALQIFCDPVLFFVILPLQIVANAGDFLLDLATLLIGGLLHWCLIATTKSLSLLQVSAVLEPVPSYANNVANASIIAAERAATHLVDLLSFDHSAAGTNSYFLLGSLQAHNSLIYLKSSVQEFTDSVLAAWEKLSNEPGLFKFSTIWGWSKDAATLIYRDVWQDLAFVGDIASQIKNGNIFALTLRQPRPLSLDPLLSYWTGKDRAITICIGYGFLALAGSIYLLRTQPFFSSATLQKAEKAFADVLRQAGGVVKVILIISIEMLLFPLYCGVLFDIALLPLFEGVTVESRFNYFCNRPYMFTFLHWFLGTAYMFNFALFVSMCRGILRSGVLYFIRDPDDPTFHPVRDVLERNIATQLRKIAFSALVYGLMVICCMGGVVWGISNMSNGVFPLKWSTPDPALEFPLEFILYNFLSPFLFKLLKPTIGMETIYKWWLRRSARMLRLSHFLFGERKEDEEGQPGSSGTPSNSGSYVRVPASDQVRIQRGQPVFTPVSAEEVSKDDADQDCDRHGRPNQRFRNVYIPPWFRARIGLFLACLWFLSAGIGTGLTVLPLVLGRKLCAIALPDQVAMNDIWTFSLGLHTLLLTSFVLFRLPALSTHLGGRIQEAAGSVFLVKLRLYISCLARSLYVYGFLVIVIPTTAFLLMQLYIVIPIRTYVESTTPAGGPGNVSLNPAHIANLFAGVSNSHSTLIAPTSSNDTPALHVVYALPDWTLGFVVSRLITTLLGYTRYPLPAAILRQITRNGRLDPDAWGATRAIVLPTLLLCTVALLIPAAFGGLVNIVLLPAVLSSNEAIGNATRTKIYRYAYPIVLLQVLALWASLGTNRAFDRWKGRIKDEVYLVGERLHNFGEKKPPRGSKGIMKKGKEPAVVQ